MLKSIIFIAIGYVFYSTFTSLIEVNNEVEKSENFKNIEKLKLYGKFVFRINFIISICSLGDGGFSFFFLFISNSVLDSIFSKYIEKEKEFLSEVEKEFFKKEEQEQYERTNAVDPEAGCLFSSDDVEKLDEEKKDQFINARIRILLDDSDRPSNN